MKVPIEGYTGLDVSVNDVQGYIAQRVVTSRNESAQNRYYEQPQDSERP